MEGTNYDHLFEVPIVGDDVLARTSLMRSYYGEEFDLSYVRSNIGIDFRTGYFQHGEKVIKIQAWDTPFYARYRSFVYSYLRRSKGVMVTYAVTKEKSFKAIRMWKDAINDYFQYAPASATPVVMIVGNKYLSEEKREVSEERGRMLAAEYGLMFMEVNAKTGHNVERAFVKMVKEIIFKTEMQSVKPSTLCPWNSPEWLQPIYQISVSGSEIITAREKALVLTIRDDTDQLCSLPTSAINARLACCSTKRVVTELDRGRYEIACQPTTPGLHTLEVKVHGRPVKGSPFAVRVIRSLDTPVRMIEGLNGPRGVAVNSKGEVIVCEADAKCVSIFSSTGERIRTIERIHGHPLGTVGGVAVDQSDNILVLDSDSCLLRVFSPEGEELKAVHLTTSNGSHPSGVCANRETGHVYIVDHSAHCVHMLTQDLTESVGKFGSQGSGNGQFNSPCDIACDSAGDVYVSDTDNHRIQVFTPDRCYLRQFGKEGSGPGELNGPIGICIDSVDIVYVGELHNQRISVLTTDGEWIKCFGCEGSGPGQFDGVFGMTVDHSGVLYVSDYGNKRVLVFH